MCCSGFFEQCRDCLMVLHAGEPEGRSLPAIGFMHVYSVTEQYVSNLGMAVEGSADKSRVLIWVGLIAISTLLQ